MIAEKLAQHAIALYWVEYLSDEWCLGGVKTLEQVGAEVMKWLSKGWVQQVRVRKVPKR